MKAQLKTSFWIVMACLALGLSTPSARAFALLGPVQMWMQASNGVVWPGDIGGPMPIGSGYRWNVPVVTYGFDKSFLDFFGTNGVAAVEGAIKILNDLPPASAIELTNYPFASLQTSPSAQAQSLVDLKSQTLTLLLEQMGLAPPTRNIYVLHDLLPCFFTNYNLINGITVVGMPISYELGSTFPNPGDGTPDYATNFIAGFNFDPETLNPSSYINNVGYWAYIEYGANVDFDLLGYGQFEMVPLTSDPFGQSAVSDYLQYIGQFWTGLTRDDIGGLRYLLSTNNINYETLLPGVCGMATNADSFVNGARRPGVDKITFVPQPTDSLSGTFLPMTNQFTDNYFTNGILKQQQVARVISQPDFLFLATDTGNDDINSGSLTRTGTTNWINNAFLNGNTNGEGPGVIQPPIKINFGRAGRQMYNYVVPLGFSDDLAEDFSSPLSTFDDSTNAPVIYPAPQTGTNKMIFRMWLSMGPNNYAFSPQNTHYHFEWSPVSLTGTPFILQTSTNLADWITLFSVTNNGSISYYFVNNPASMSRFYRLIPQ